MSLPDQLKQVLGVVPPPTPTFYKTSAVAPSSAKSGWAPPRPEEEHEYRVSVYRSEYGSILVKGTSNADAKQAMWDEHHNIDWHDCGDTEVEQVDDLGVANQDEIDEWDELYSDLFDTDGQPMCSSCREMFNHAHELTTDPDDESRWLCADCLSDEP